MDAQSDAHSGVLCVCCLPQLLKTRNVWFMQLHATCILCGKAAQTHAVWEGGQYTDQIIPLEPKGLSRSCLLIFTCSFP